MCDECDGASLVLNKTEASADMGWTVDHNGRIDYNWARAIVRVS
jgi:hypothetical protein